MVTTPAYNETAMVANVNGFDSMSLHPSTNKYNAQPLRIDSDRSVQYGEKADRTQNHR